MLPQLKHSHVVVLHYTRSKSAMLHQPDHSAVLHIYIYIYIYIVAILKNFKSDCKQFCTWKYVGPSIIILQLTHFYPFQKQAKKRAHFSVHINPAKWARSKCHKLSELVPKTFQSSINCSTLMDTPAIIIDCNSSMHRPKSDVTTVMPPHCLCIIQNITTNQQTNHLSLTRKFSAHPWITEIYRVS